MVPPNITNTNQGINVEYLLRNSIDDHQRAFSKLKLAVGVHAHARPNAIEVVGGSKRKADVEIRFPNRPPVRVSVKSFRLAGYNHIERGSLETFFAKNQLLRADQEFISMLFERKSNRARGNLVEPEERVRIRKIFSRIEPGVAALLGNDHPQFLALYSIEHARFHIYHMNTQVEPLVRTEKIGFTSRSSNIEIGEYIVFQRKGSKKEPGGRDNDYQLKMRVRRFFDEVEPLAHYEL